MEGLIDMLHFVIVGMWLAVRSYDAVDEETAVVGLVAEVAAVGPELIRLQGQGCGVAQGRAVDGLCESLVSPVPDGGADDGGVGIDDVPVLLEVAHGVAHGMAVLAHHEWSVCDAFGDALHLVGVEVAVVVDGRVATVAVVERWTCWIQGNNGIAHGFCVCSSSCLVAQTPKNDARMVAVTQYQRGSTIYMCL